MNLLLNKAAESGIPNLGKRLMAKVIDELAVLDPERRICSMPEPPDSAKAYGDLSTKTLAHAINSLSWWIVQSFGKGDCYKETLAYMGPNDVRYLVMVVACNKTGYKPLMSSTRNSTAAHVRLFQMVGCSKLAVSIEKGYIADEICSETSNVQRAEVPSFLDLISNDCEAYPFEKTYEEIENEVAFIAHSSGTTGFPKPIHFTFGYFGALDFGRYVPVPDGRVAGVPDRLSSNDLILSTTPFFHLMGFALLIMAVFHGVPCVIMPDKPLSTDLVRTVISTTKPTAALFPPSILEDLSSDSASLGALSRLKRVYFGGGPLSPDVGNKVARYTQLVSFLGMTEGGFVLSLLPENGDWSYFEWSPTFGIKMEHVENGLCEMVIHRHERFELQPIFHTFPDLDAYHTKDLYAPHPEVPNLWKFQGRLDDVIVFNNGEKFNPVTMEKIIEGHSLVSRALVVGLGRFQTALLIEPSWAQVDALGPDANTIDLVWPTVEEANRISPAHGHVMKNRFGLSSREKPFATTPKGSTRRGIVTTDYKEEIEQLYEAPDVEEVPFTLPANANLPTILEFVRNVVFHVSNLASCADDTDLYNAGLDSLRTIQLARALRSAGLSDITPQTIYRYPTIRKLASFLHTSQSGSPSSETTSRRELIDGLVAKYTADLPYRCAKNSLTVALTGSTGSLGCYLLDALCADRAVKKIYCLTRDGSKERQKTALNERGLDGAILYNDKVEFIKTSLGEDKLGINKIKYNEILKSVNIIVHNAWWMDFNVTVESFEAVYIRAIRSLIDFSLSSSHGAHIHFMSSIGAVGGWTHANGASIPEVPFEDCNVTLRQGYGEAKHICERIYLAASKQSGVPISIHRLGQIAGPSSEKGFWNTSEWLPALVKTSKFIGKIPESLGAFKVDWVPVDSLAKIIIDIVHMRHETEEEDTISVFHLVNPTSVSWETLLDPVNSIYKLETVPMEQWITELRTIESPSPSDLDSKPALKILDFYESLVAGQGALSVPLECERAKEASHTMRVLQPISTDMMSNWLKRWDF
ncbi:uncharacterized protein BDV14DRAFT_170376 [Aspergillus stella-maris]|uniref:uncharacterized protein n=1 Tax=Aspergillus stella-maris TaxID=1810926 RepID=UPI003CCD95B7